MIKDLYLSSTSKLINPLFSCQHGDLECSCNMAQACMLKLLPEQKDIVPTIKCMMSNQPTLGNF